MECYKFIKWAVSSKTGVFRHITGHIMYIVLDDLSIMKTRLFKYIENFTTKNWKFSDKNSDIFHISVQTIDCGYSLELPHWGSSNEYPQYMFLSRNLKNNVYPCKPQVYYIKIGFKGVKIILVCFRDETAKWVIISYHHNSTKHFTEIAMWQSLVTSIIISLWKVVAVMVPKP